MNDFGAAGAFNAHNHIFLGTGHERNERKTWAVIALCGVMMIIEIAGGEIFGSLALVADGLHMSTHAGAMLIAALAYTYARRHASDARFVFGTGKLGDLAGFTSAIVLAMIALLIGYEAIARFLAPVPIHFAEAIPIAIVGLLVNVASAWLLSGHEHGGHEHGGEPGFGHDRHDHTHHDHGGHAHANGAAGHDHSHHGQGGGERVEQTGGHEQPGQNQAQGATAYAVAGGHSHAHAHPHVHDDHHDQGHHDHHDRRDDDHVPAMSAHRDNNIRSAYVHVLADAAVSVLAIVGLVLARAFGWLWMDPVAGIIGAVVIANWSYRLLRDTGGILLDMNPDHAMTVKLREAIECDGDRLVDLHLWRLGPGHLGAVVSIVTAEARDPGFYRARLQCFKSLCHVTVEVAHLAAHTDAH